jgi:site-specific DNA recombinase
VSEAIKNPEVIIAALREQIEDQKGGLAKENNIDTEVKNLNRKTKGYDGQEMRLVKLLRLGVINEDVILDELNQIKADRKADLERLAELE